MADVPTGLIYMKGDYTVSVLVHAFDVEQLSRSLPAELELAPQELAPPGKHPVNLLYGHERQVHFNFLPFLQVDYHEFGFVIPYVRWKQPRYPYPGPFLFTAVIFVDKKIIAFGGDNVYGMPKQLALFDVQGANYTVTANLSGTNYSSVEFSEPGAPVKPRDRATIRKLMQQPSVSRKSSGEYVCSGFDWNLPQATLHEQSARGHLTPSLLPGVPVGTFPLEAQGTEQLSEGRGCYQMHTQWTLTLPGSPGRDWSPWNGTERP